MNKFRNFVLYAVLVAVSAVLLLGIRATERVLDAQVSEHRLRFTGEIRNAPPMVIFTTVAMGSFRGVVADLLWLRASSLQDKRSYFEMVQLARWITDLQPNFAGATRYLAWNMAYNISVTCSNFADRWRWVNEGIRLIRDQAIEYNPEDPQLYTELAWIYHHKMGNIMDDANQYYKNQLALGVMSVVGSSPDWEKIANSPRGEAAFMREYPAGGLFWTAARQAGYSDYEALLRAFGSAPALPTLPGNLLTELGAELGGKVDAALRAELFYRRFKLEPRRMVALDRKYGDFDWRMPESFAIYWATRGIEIAPDGRNIECDRVVTQALHDSFRFGRLLMIDEKNFESLQIVPNLALVDAVYNTFTEKQYLYDGEDSFFSSFRTARINFMKEAVVTLYGYGHFKKAGEYFKKLVAEDGPQPDGADVESFVMAQFVRDVQDAEVRKASEIISMLIFRSINYLVYNDPDAAVASERIARHVYRSYASYRGTEKRVQLPPYADMKKAVVERCVSVFPPAMVAILKARIAAEQLETVTTGKETSGGTAPGNQK